MNGINPFQSTRILVPDKFIGRRNLLSEIFSRVQGGGHTSIVAQRRMGKSSLLYYMTHPTVHRIYEKYLGASDGYLFLYLDSHESTISSQMDFSRLILRLAEATLTAQGCSVEALARLQEREDFVEVDDLIHIILTEYQRKMVLLIDEFEYFVDSPGLDTPFFKKLRALGDSQRIGFITASHKTLAEIVQESQGPGSEFWNIFHTTYLPLLTIEEVMTLFTQYLRLANNEVKFDDEDIEFLLQRIGTHPYFFQQAARKIFDRKHIMQYYWTSDYEYDEIFQSLLSEEWNNLYNYYQKMTNYQKMIVLEFLESEEGMNTYTDSYRPNLIEKQIIVHHKDGWRLFSPLFRSLVENVAKSHAIYLGESQQGNTRHIAVNTNTNEITINGNPINPPLTAMEDKILRYLLVSEGRYRSKEELAEVLWPDEVLVSYDEAIQAHIYRLRKKLEAESDGSVRIETLKGRGYRILQFDTDH